jgi:hypothetical protein
MNEDADELQNVLVAEEKRRKKAKSAATKKSDTPFGAEAGAYTRPLFSST